MTAVLSPSTPPSMLDAEEQSLALVAAPSGPAPSALRPP